MIAVRGKKRLNPCLPISGSELRRMVSAVMQALGLEQASVEVEITDDWTMAGLNERFLGLPGPTNVLGFPADDPEDPRFMGQIAISADSVTREADLYGQNPGEHLVRLLCHGILHLAGREHGPEMYDLTEEIVLKMAHELDG